MPRPRGLPKTGGRKPGSRNKASAEREAQVKASGLTPLEFMLNLLRDEQADLKDRFEAAKHAAPYVHPKRAPEDGNGDTTPNAIVYVPTDRPVPRP